MSKIILIIPYFGSWPKWLPAFLLSCKKNESINWLIFTDCPIPNITYSNIRFVKMNLGQFLELASAKLGFPVIKTSYSQCDLKPTYGVIFEEYIKGYDFWGHCDLDVIWGDIRNFYNEKILENHDIISSRKNNLSGHLNLWKNSTYINYLFKEIPGYQSMLTTNSHVGFDEPKLSTFLKIHLLNKNNVDKVKLSWEINRDLLGLEVNFVQKVLAKKIEHLNIYWPKQPLIDEPELDANPVGWHWENGKLFDKNNVEKFYIHFRIWKAYFKNIDFEIGEEPRDFRILRRGIWSKQLPIKEKILDIIQPRYKTIILTFLIFGFKAMIMRVRRHVFLLDNSKNW